MKWSIPAKTFLLGEYAAIAGAPALVLTTSPCFELTLLDKPGLFGIHAESPAGRWWLAQDHTKAGLQWYDPYQGRGGMGASSAQFLGAYLASMHLQKKHVYQQAMLDAYLHHAGHEKGVQPSGYDVLAQSLSGCVYIDRQHNLCQSFAWPFQDIAFILLHTGQKLATHIHLQAMSLPSQLQPLVSIVEKAKKAFELADSQGIVDAVNAYYQQLAEMQLIAENTLQQVDRFKKQADVLAVKGCGAMGADVLLLLVPTKKQTSIQEQLSSSGWTILATSADLYTRAALLPVV